MHTQHFMVHNLPMFLEELDEFNNDKEPIKICSHSWVIDTTNNTHPRCSIILKGFYSKLSEFENILRDKQISK